MTSERNADAVSKTIQAMYDAVRAGDMKAVRALFAPDFYVYEHGVRFDADGLIDLLEKAQAAGAVFEWAVTQPDVGIAGDTAWIAYVNQGAVTRDGKRQPVTWMESGVLRHEGGGWLIRFMHSTRVIPSGT
jgi:ketosteroid isomerase-like protein